MKFTIKIETTCFEDDATGRTIIRFTPVIRPLHCATGELRTAHFEAWLDEPETIAAQKQAAHAGALETLKYLFC